MSCPGEMTMGWRSKSSKTFIDSSRIDRCANHAYQPVKAVNANLALNTAKVHPGRSEIGAHALGGQKSYSGSLRQCSSLNSSGVMPKRRSKAFDSCAPVE